ncbi:MAG: hypothetical protein H7144_15990 [Burkholderiales bacterium]|nr:hypothetical protein [Phycisphaerae bacterium]
MSLIDRVLPDRKVVSGIGELIQQLPLATTWPDRTLLRCVSKSSTPMGACDWMSWSLWQDEDNGEIWIFYSGGIANVALCYGPGDRSVALQFGVS